MSAFSFGCRGKDSAPAPQGATGPSGGAEARPTGDGWVAVIDAGKDTALLTLASGAKGTVVAIHREPGSTIAVNGLAAGSRSDKEGLAVLQLDHAGQAQASVIENTRSNEVPPLVVDTEVLLGTNRSTSGGKADLLTLASITGSVSRQPIDGTVQSITRAADAVWLSGSNWGDGSAMAKDKCGGKSFVARGAGNSFTPIHCGANWTSMQLSTAGADLLFCGSQFSGPTELGGATTPGPTWLARLASDGSVKWLRSINEIGTSRCSDVVVTSDGDIVATGVANDNVDFTEDAVAKKRPERDATDGSGTKLWVARYGGDGVRRWARIIGEIVLAEAPSLAADAKGNALVAAPLTGRLDVGDGPVGPEGGVVAALDRDGKLAGLLALDGSANSPRIATEPSNNGLVIGVTTNASEGIRVGKLRVEPKPNFTAVVFRVPLPLPSL